MAGGIRRITVLLTALSLGGCKVSVTRPDQDNFTFIAGNHGIEVFVAALERRIGTAAEPQDLNIPDSDPTRMFQLAGSGFTVLVNPVADERCNFNAPRHATYRTGEYRIDLVYSTRSEEKRQRARRMLVDAATDVGKPLASFKEC